jgi:hypothetical protein
LAQSHPQPEGIAVLESFLESLRNHKDELLVLVSLTAVCVSFLAALLGPLVQWRIARLNALATVLMANRIKWIEGAQSDIATYAALLERTEFLEKSMDELQRQYPQPDAKQRDEFDRMFREYEDKTFERNKLGNLIGIKLNVPREKRQKLFDAIDKFAKHTSGTTTGSPDQVDAMANVQEIARSVLDEEWLWIERNIGRRRRAP